MLCTLEAKLVKGIPIICKYLNVFLEDLPGMPPNRDIKSRLILFLDKEPIAERPYHMSFDKLEELKK